MSKLKKLKLWRGKNQNSNLEKKILKLILWQNSNTQISTKLKKVSSCDKIQQLKLWQNSNSNLEFLKAANMQSHDCAKYLRICISFWLMNKKQEKLELMRCICHNLTKFSSFMCFYDIFKTCFCLKLLTRGFWLRL